MHELETIRKLPESGGRRAGAAQLPSGADGAAPCIAKRHGLFGQRLSFQRVLVGLAALWLLALLAEGWGLIDAGTAAWTAWHALAQKRREAGRLVRLDPSSNVSQPANLGAELATAEDILARLQAEFAGDAGASAHPSGMSGRTDPRAEPLRDAGRFVRDLHERVRRAGVGIRPEEQFGIAETGRDSRSPEAITAHRRQREATDFLIRALLAARPSKLVSVQCARPPGSRPTVSAALLPLKDGEGGTVEIFDVDPRLSVREAGVIETLPIKVVFVGRTAALRRFLNQLSAGRPAVIIREIAVEPAPTGDSLRQGRSNGAGPVALLVRPALSQFAVTVEYCELDALPIIENGSARPAAQLPVDGGACGMGNLPVSDGRTPARGQDAGATPGIRHPPCLWPEPALQKRGRGWCYEIFTPPALFHDLRSHALAAVPAEEAAPAESEIPSFDLQLLEVRQKPFWLRLVGFAGSPEALKGIFADMTTGKTLMGRVGDRLAGHPLRLTRLGLDTRVFDTKGTNVCVATATVSDEGTGEEIVLTTRGPSPAGAPLGLFASQKHPDWRRELQEGESAVVEGVRYCVERVELEPPLAVVTCVPADGAKGTGRTLIPQNPPDAVRGIPALRAAEHVSLDSPTTR